MNIWTRKSIELANQKNYLDLLYRVYPISENVRREISDSTKNDISNFFNGRNNIELLKILIDQTNKKQIVFPIKDSYVAFLKHDNSAIDRNPNTVDRITSILYEMGYDELINKATSPKETNRQIGPLFGNWINKGSLGVNHVDDELTFLNSTENLIYSGSDDYKSAFARKYLGYRYCIFMASLTLLYRKPAAPAILYISIYIYSFHQPVCWSTYAKDWFSSKAYLSERSVQTALTQQLNLFVIVSKNAYQRLSTHPSGKDSLRQ